MVRHQDGNSTTTVTAFSAGGSSSSTSHFVPRLLGSAIAGFSELVLFHPVDTIAKRLMSNQGKVSEIGLNKIIFKNAANDSAFTKWKSLFPGLGFAAGYKVLQRVYKFGGQPYVNDWMNSVSGDYLVKQYGKQNGHLINACLSGSLMGVGEVILLPLDVLKIKSQTNPEVLKGRGVFDIFVKEGRGLYRGATWTAARNAPGSFALFGGSAFVHYKVYGLDNPKQATVFQNLVASMVGAICSITVAAPLDVVKTRIQNKSFEVNESGFTVVKNLVRDEGLTAFFKGLTPKIIVVGPKLIFSFTVAQSLINYFERVL